MLVQRYFGLTGALFDAALFEPVDQRAVGRGEKMPQPEKRNQEREQAQTTLPTTLHDTFDRLVDEYEVCAKIHGEVSVNYNILADLVHVGWRRVL
jgi:hypothetical protein